MRTFQVSHRDHDLPAMGHRVALMGASNTISWPSLCPNCGQPASERLSIQKVFRRKNRHRAWRYVVTRIDVAFCAGCAARHRARRGAAGPLRRMGHAPHADSARRRLPPGRPRFSTRDPDDERSSGRWLALGIFAFLATTAGASIVGAWRANRPYRVPKSTEVSSAFDYSDDLGNVFVGKRRVFAIRSGAFADALTAANRDRLWTDEIRERDRRRTGVVSVCILLALLAAWALTR